jgi:predicted alpha-1,2-mannosidase
MKQHSFLIFAISLALLQGTNAQVASKKLVDYVNPFIGTGSYDANSLAGNNFPGATTPFGFVQLSPDTREAPGYPCSGYDYYDKFIFGFSHTHLSGTGVPDLFDVLVMPAIDKAKDSLIYRSRFSHEQEQAKPGYYQVKLLDYNINAELTATEHVGFHRYTFPKSQDAQIVINLEHSTNKKTSWIHSDVLLSQLKVINNTTIEGYRIITGWVEGFRKVYFRAEFSKPFKQNVSVDKKGKFENIELLNGKDLMIALNFDTQANEQILVKVGLSATSVENARLNLSTEVPDWNFDNVAQNASNQWESELGKIVADGTKEQLEIFYTGMYHAFIQPNNIADVNGDYLGTDMVTHNAADKKHFSTFSLWDTYRAAHPLYTLLQPKLTANFVNSMVRQNDTFGFLPIWQLWGLENYCMIGNHAIPVVVDAALKNLKGFELEKAYQAVKASSTVEHENSPFKTWEKYGYIPEDVVSQSVSITLEMAYDDWCVAQLAKKLGKTADYQHFMKRSAFYTNLFDSKTKFFRAKNKDGKWLTPFNPLKYGDNGNAPYTEGNAWQYLFYVPQDMNNLVTLMGGKNAFCAKLDTMFSLKDAPSVVNHNASGLIGQYAHGNEPSHHVGYLYNFAGQPWKSQKLVAQIQNELYNNTYSGYQGNEDCGQMSSWYIFSAMGFYPVNPANSVYVIGSPTLKSAEIKLENGVSFKITTKNVSKQNVYIQSVKLNDKPYTKTYITHNDIVKGGSLEFEMGKKPNKKWGTAAGDVPPATGY